MMSATTKVPPAKLARAVEWIRHYLCRLHQRLTPAPAAMIEMILAGWTSQAITVAAQLGVADALANGPLPIDELAARVDADPDAKAFYGTLNYSAQRRYVEPIGDAKTAETRARRIAKVVSDLKAGKK